MANEVYLNQEIDFHVSMPKIRRLIILSNSNNVVSNYSNLHIVNCHNTANQGINKAKSSHYSFVDFSKFTFKPSTSYTTKETQTTIHSEKYSANINKVSKVKQQPNIVENSKKLYKKNLRVNTNVSPDPIESKLPSSIIFYNEETNAIRKFKQDRLSINSNRDSSLRTTFTVYNERKINLPSITNNFLDLNCNSLTSKWEDLQPKTSTGKRFKLSDLEAQRKKIKRIEEKKKSEPTKENSRLLTCISFS